MAEKKLTFEKALAKLEAIVEKLESGEISLDDSIAAFEEGQKLVDFCLKNLSEAESKVKKLSRDIDGNFELNDF
ncbi:exodeoxyribonuclease VII small subunit [candidate division KSB1 bacterium]|jgi:exodeoxyribonuclease VII small subunit|nr:MAG: exodeoxyribonuclease VII small subunit [candidate division KSB1 bacterium]